MHYRRFERTGSINRRTENHGLSFRSEYGIWKSVKARGCEMYPPWAESFLTFLAAIGPRPSLRHRLTRTDRKRGYFPGNVSWITKEIANDELVRK
jgi:hypothetical protein